MKTNVLGCRCILGSWSLIYFLKYILVIGRYSFFPQTFFNEASIYIAKINRHFFFAAKISKYHDRVSFIRHEKNIVLKTSAQAWAQFLRSVLNRKLNEPIDFCSNYQNTTRLYFSIICTEIYIGLLSSV